MVRHLVIVAWIAALATAESVIPTTECGTIEPLQCSSDISCGDAISKAITLCSSKGGGIVRLAAGKFHMQSSASLAPSVVVQNVQNVALIGANSGTFDTSGVCTVGNGGPTSVLVLHGISAGFEFVSCNNILVQDIAVDMARLPFTYGTCVASDATGMIFEFDASTYPFATANGSVPTWLQSTLAIMEYSEHLRAPPKGGTDVYLTSTPLATSFAPPNRMHVHRNGTTAGVTVNRSYVVRHAVYGGDGVHLAGSTNLHFLRTILWAAPGMGFYAGTNGDTGSGNITLENTGVCRRPGLPMSITADASHFNECTGHITLDKVHFEAQGDDGLNVHGMFHAIIAKNTSDPNSFVLGSRPAGGMSPLHPGHRYEFRNRSTWRIEGTATLLSAASGPAPLSQAATFVFDGGVSVAKSISLWALLTDVDLQPSVVVRDSFFGYNRARGNLIKTSNVIVTNTTYGPVTGPCVQAFPDGCFWFESGGFHNWTLRNNTMRGCGGTSDVFVASCGPRWSAQNTPLAQGDPITVGQPFANVTIDGCRFVQPEGNTRAAIALYGSDGLTITNNIVEIEKASPAVAPRLAPRVVPNTIQHGPRDWDVLSAAPPAIMGSFDGFDVSVDGAQARGWVVDPSLPANASSNVSFFVDGKIVLTLLANSPRPDLVPKVTKFPDHGFDTTLPATTAATLRDGSNHTLEVFAWYANGSTGHGMVALRNGGHPALCCVNPLRWSCYFPTDCSCGAPLPPPLLVSNSLRCAVGNNTCYGVPCPSLPAGACTSATGQAPQERSTPLATTPTAPSPCDLLKACSDPAACPALREVPPPTFDVVYVTTRGNLTVHVHSDWAPPYAQRFWSLSRVGYMDGASFYRVDRNDTGGFVVQFGYRGEPAIDQCWDNTFTSNATWSVHAPGNVRGTVAFSMGAVDPSDAHNPNCTSSAYCAQGFSTNIFINYGNNTRLDAPGFSVFGTVDDAGMRVVDALYAGYGDCTELCNVGSTDPYCRGLGAACKGVSMTTLTARGNAYLAPNFPLLDYVTSTHVVIP